MAAQDPPYNPLNKITTEELQTPPTENPQPNQAQSQKTPNKGFSPALSVMGVVLISVILFMGAYFYLQSLQDQNVGDTEKIEAEEREEDEKKLEQIEENARDDSTRKLDLASLKTGLEKHISGKGEYPKKLEELTPDYTRVIPLDPITKEPYSYSPDEELASYTLLAKLSDGSTYTLSSANQ